MNKNRFESKQVNSFDKNFFAKINFKKPDKYRDIENFSLNSENIITSGSYYNYSPASFHKDSMSLDLSRFNRILSFDRVNQEITVEAGILIHELLNVVLKENLWIPQLPGYPFITLGGAVAANVHGKSCGAHGTIRKSIKKILLFHRVNGWIELSDEKNKEIFDLTIGGLGLTGTIVNITFKLSVLKNPEFVTAIKKVYSVKDCIQFIKNNKSEDTYIYSWNRADGIKKFGEGFVFKNQVKQDENSRSLKKLKFKKNSFFNYPLCLWNKTTIKLANTLYSKILSSKQNEIYEKFEQVIFPFSGKETYFNFFGNKGFIETQLLIDENELEIFFDEFDYLYKIYDPTITLFSIKNISGEQKLLRFESDRMCITFDFVNNKKNIIFLKELDKLYAKYKVIPSIIKDSRLPKEIFLSCYNEAQEFKDRLRSFDKKRIYKSELSERLEI